MTLKSVAVMLVAGPPRLVLKNLEPIRKPESNISRGALALVVGVNRG